MLLFLLAIFILALIVFLLYRSAQLFFLPRYTNRWTHFLYCGLAFLALLLPNILQITHTKIVYILFLGCYVVCLLCLTRLFYGEGRLFFWVGFSIVTLLCCQILTFVLASFLIDEIQSQKLLQIIFITIQGIFPAVVQLLLSYLIISNEKKQSRKISVLLTSSTAFIALFLLVRNTYSLILAPVTLIAICGLAIGIILVFFTIRLLQQEKIIQQQTQQIFEKEGATLQAQADQKYYQEIRKLVHSFNQFALELDKQIAAQENQTAQKSLEDFLYQLNQNLASIHTNHSALDALLFYYLKKYPQIKFDYQLTTLTNTNEELEQDLLMLSGNFLTLAIQGLEKIPSDNSKITMTLKEENNLLILEVRTTPVIPELTSIWQKNQLQESLAETLARYSGDLDFQQINNQSVISILLFLKNSE